MASCNSSGLCRLAAQAFHSIPDPRPAELDIESPWTFELVKPTDQSLRTHCGVLEFIADEGTVNLPAWVSRRTLAKNIRLL